MKKSLWKAFALDGEYEKLNENIAADVAIIGGGITGIMTAWLLARTGVRVVVLEARNVGEGTTADSTGNLYSVTDKRLHHVQKFFDNETLKAVIESRTDAVNLIESLVYEHNISCDFQRRPWYLYSEKPGQDDLIIKEKKALEGGGLEVISLNSVPLPFPVSSAIMVERQAQFNPAAFVKGLAIKTSEAGCRIFTHTPVLDIKSGTPHLLVTPSGNVSARWVVMATHTPKGIFPVQTSLGPYREYALAGKLNSGEYPEGIFWSAEPEHHISVRSFHKDGESYIVIVGEDHKVGQADDHLNYYERLENFARKRFDIGDIQFRWSAQHYKPADGLPYIGESMEKNIYIATGFSTDGLVYGGLAALILSDLIQDKQNSRAELYKAKRFTPLASGEKFLKETINVAGEYIREAFETGDNLPVRMGEGKVIRKNGEKWAVYRDPQGEIHAVSAVCPHMKCIVNWNNAEKTWDCPCHGSRFTYTGEVIEGPAYNALEKKSADDIQ